MLFIKKNSILLILIILFFVTRLTNLLVLPIFNDEATYIDWSFRMVNIKGQMFHSLLHAKPPLLMWIVGLNRNLISNPLLAGRIVSVFFGLLTALGLYKISRDFISKKTAQFSLIFYIIIPLFLFFDRQALMESAVAASGIWGFYFSYKFLKDRNYVDMFFAGIIVGLGYLIKTSAIVYLIPIILVLVFNLCKNNQKEKTIYGITIFTCSFILTTIPLLMNESFWKTLNQNNKYIFSLSEILKLPFTSWLNNIVNFSVIALVYLNPLFICISLVYLFKKIIKKNFFYSYLLFYAFFGILFDVFISRNTLVRHTMPMIPLLIIPASNYLADNIKNKYKKSVLILITMFSSIFLSLILIFSPLSYFNILDIVGNVSQKAEYVTYWSSGYGFNEVKNYIDELSKKSPIIVGVRLDAGIPENAVFAYFQDSDKVRPIYLDSVMFKDFKSYECITSKYPGYFVSRDNNYAGLEKYLIELKRVNKPEDQHYIAVHKIRTENCQENSLVISK